ITPFEIEDFVDGISDISNVSMEYVNAPDYNTDGSQQIVIRFTDEAGNYTERLVNLQVAHDHTGPEIYADDDIYVYWNEPVSYKSLVTVVDDMDSEPTLEVDNSNVDISTVGTYELTYKATDNVGNTTSKTVNFHVIEPDTDEYYLMKANELCDAIIEQVTTPDMDIYHKVWACYEYVRNIDYVLTDYTRNYIREGYKILKNKSGDCYGSYAAMRLLLDRLGVQNLPVEADERYGNRHFWNLVTFDGENWYHVDATNWIYWDYKPRMCMISDARINEISAQHRGTHIFETADYPATPYYSMPVPDDLWGVYEIYDW
ncbi:MAG: transglutaminase domain-containing protein, partial [Parasporobacterium sp.]|nr:transglutaminase domain-containing protein [Parasporobacterium sp.]